MKIYSIKFILGICSPVGQTCFHYLFCIILLTHSIIITLQTGGHHDNGFISLMVVSIAYSSNNKYLLTTILKLLLL